MILTANSMTINPIVFNIFSFLFITFCFITNMPSPNIAMIPKLRAVYLIIVPVTIDKISFASDMSSSCSCLLATTESASGKPYSL